MDMMFIKTLSLFVILVKIYSRVIGEELQTCIVISLNIQTSVAIG